MTRINPDSIYQKVCSKLPIKAHMGSIYIKDKRYWSKLTEQEATLRIYGMYSENVQGTLRDADVKETIKRILNTPKLQLEFADKVAECFVNLQNGVFNVETGKMICEEKNVEFSYVMDFSYKEKSDIKKSSEFQHFVEAVFPNECEKKTTLLLQIMGYCLSDYLKAKAGFFFIGASNSGKSTMLNLMKKILPEKSVTAIPLYRLENRFNIAKLADSRLNINSEISEKSFKALDVFKQLTSNETVTAEHKGQRPFEFRIRCKSINAGNMLPNLDAIEGMDAVLNRMIILCFPKGIPKEQQDLQLFEKLWNERDIIFSMALDELVKLRKHNFNFVEPEDSRQIKAQLDSQSKVFEDFLADYCVLDKEERVHVVTLYEAFISYCTDNLLEAKYS